MCQPIRSEYLPEPEQVQQQRVQILPRLLQLLLRTLLLHSCQHLTNQKRLLVCVHQSGVSNTVGLMNPCDSPLASIGTKKCHVITSIRPGTCNNQSEFVLFTIKNIENNVNCTYMLKNLLTLSNSETWVVIGSCKNSRNQSE